MMTSPEPLDYERTGHKASFPIRGRWHGIAGPLCIIGAGMFAIAAALLLGFARITEVMLKPLPDNSPMGGVGGLLLVGAVLLAVVGFLRWSSE